MVTWGVLQVRVLTFDRFWGIFWIDASSWTTAHQGLLGVARILGLVEDTKAVKQWLSNSSEYWLLILDNADDPSLDVSEFFPPGNRGTILVTTRNPECKIHATVGSYEYGGMDLEEAVTLLLRAAGVEDTADATAGTAAAPVANILGCLALAIVQAGAYVRKGFCSIEEYCDIYSRRREKLLSHRSAQTQSEYKYTVYTTWEVSVEAIKMQPERSSGPAIELIRLFCFLHYEGISEDIFKRANENSYDGRALYNNIANLHCIGSHNGRSEWDPMVFREAASLLASFSLIKMEDMGRRMSMHPLVHVWVKDCLLESMQRQYWTAATSIVALAIPIGEQVLDYQLRRSLVPHIDSCVSLCRDVPFISAVFAPDRIDMAESFALVLADNGRLLSALKLREGVLEATKTALGEEHPLTLYAMQGLANSYSDIGWLQKELELREKVFEERQRTVGNEYPDTVTATTNLAIVYTKLGRTEEALDLFERVLEMKRRVLGEEHPRTLRGIGNIAYTYSMLGRGEEAVQLREEVLTTNQRALGEEHPETLSAMNFLADSYRDRGRSQEAMRLAEKVFEASLRTLGDEHPNTLKAMNNLAIIKGRSDDSQVASSSGTVLQQGTMRSTPTTKSKIFMKVQGWLKNSP